MAFSLKIEVELKHPRKRKITIEPSWWHIIELKKQYPFREECDGTYLDYYLEMDFELFKKIHLEQLPRAANSLYGLSEWRKINGPVILRLEKVLAKPAAFRKAIITIFEWESGLN